MIRPPPRSTPLYSSAASDVYKRQPDLRPEKSRGWEVGAEQTIVRGRASIAATYFDQRFRDMIQYNGFVDEGTPNYYNLAAATSRGVEVTLHVSPVAPLTLAASYTYTKTRVT